MPKVSLRDKLPGFAEGFPCCPGYVKYPACEIKEQGLPLRKIAAKLDLDPSTLSKIERGDRFPGKDLIRRIAQAFGIDERELLILYHSEKIANDLYREDYCIEVLEVAERRPRLTIRFTIK